MALTLINTSKRSTKLGRYGEILLEHWLMRAGCHVAQADAEGLDLLAISPSDSRRLGVSMKARFYAKPTDAGILKQSCRPKLLASCAIWSAEPWLALYYESQNHGCLIAMALSTYDAQYSKQDSKASPKWDMLDIREEALAKLESDQDVGLVRFQFSGSWHPAL